MVKRRMVWGLWLGRAMVFVAAMQALSATAQGPDLLLEAELEPRQVWVQAQTIYRLRFYHAVDVRELKMNGPAARLADVRPLGGERIYEAQRDGRRYRVHERRYAVFPLSSGALVLTGAYALGRVGAVSATSADGRQAVRLEAAAQTLTVLPVPVAAGGLSWLPARSLALSENWSTNDARIHPGQVLRRRIRVEAAGVDAGQIAPLQVLVPGMQVVAEAPQFSNRMDGELNVGMLEQVFQMVALRAGELRVPEMQLHWWPHGAEALAVAKLPARSLQVVAVEPDVAKAGVSALAATSAPSPSSMQTTAHFRTPVAEGRWLLVGSGVLLSVAMTLRYLSRPRVRAARRLQRACRVGRAGAVRDALLAWAALTWPKQSPLTLPALAERGVDPAVRQALGVVERRLYGPPAEQPDDAALRAALGTIERGSGRWFKSCRQTSSP